MLIRQFFTTVFSVTLLFLSFASSPVRAESSRAVVEMLIYGSISNQELIAQAERLATDEIRRQFNQDSERSTLDVVVVGVRNGEIIPVLTATVPRQQWSENLRLQDWTQYHATSYALLRRRGDSVIAVAPTSPRNFSENTYVDPVVQVDQAYEEGRLSQQEYDLLIDELD